MRMNYDINTKSLDIKNETEGYAKPVRLPYVIVFDIFGVIVERVSE